MAWLGMYWHLFLLTFVLLILFDLPWLIGMSGHVKKMIQLIQGSTLEFNYLPGLVVYAALAYVLIKAHSPAEAFGYGVATYAVYDFTNLATLKGYSPYFAVADTLWGGVLMGAVKYVVNYLDREYEISS